MHRRRRHNTIQHSTLLASRVKSPQPPNEVSSVPHVVTVPTQRPVAVQVSLTVPSRLSSQEAPAPASVQKVAQQELAVQFTSGVHSRDESRISGS